MTNSVDILEPRLEREGTSVVTTMDSATPADFAIGTIEQIYRYPVKSLAGETVQRAELGVVGVAGDRRYALIDVETKKIASAKNPRKWSKMLTIRATYIDEPTVVNPTRPVMFTFPNGNTISSSDPRCNAVLSDFLGREVELVTEPGKGAKYELVDANIKGFVVPVQSEDDGFRTNESGDEVATYDLNGFFDLSPLHVITTSTIAHLLTLNPGGQFDARRYRPNVVVRTSGEGFVEDAWVGAGVLLGGAEIDVSLNVPRCIMTTLAHEDLIVDRSTLRTIVKHNMIEVPGWGNCACAGVYADISDQGSIAVGDSVVRR